MNDALTFERDPALAATIRDGLARHTARENAVRPSRSPAMKPLGTPEFALAILTALVQSDPDLAKRVKVEAVNAGFGIPYDGACLFVPGREDAQLHVYLNDDEAGREVWLVQGANFESTESTEVWPMTTENFAKGVEWLLGAVS